MAKEKEKELVTVDLTVNPKKAIRRADLAIMGEVFIQASKDKKVEYLKITITDDAPGTPNSMMFPVKIVE